MNRPPIHSDDKGNKVKPVIDKLNCVSQRPTVTVKSHKPKTIYIRCHNCTWLFHQTFHVAPRASHLRNVSILTL